VDPRECLREYPQQAPELRALLNADEIDQGTRRAALADPALTAPISADHGTEPQTLTQLDHDYIVRVFDQRLLGADREPNGAIRRLRLLYMQFLPGGTLLGELRGRDRSAADLDTRADIYSLVVVMRELRTVAKPFDDSTAGADEAGDDTTLEGMLEC
jgi:hypothetical protein